MGSLLRLDVDTAGLFAAMDQAVAEIERALKSNAEITAHRIASEAEGRVRRRTGKTAAGITVEETRDGKGYVVFVQRPDMPGLPGWLEFGTRFMSKRDFFFASARLEEAAHERRSHEVVQDVLDAKGLGQ